MRIERIEPITLRLITRRTHPDAWVRTHVGDRVPFHLGTDLAALDSMPKRVEAVVLKYTLNQQNPLEDKRDILKKAKEAVQPGGVVIAIARVCDNGIELAERMVKAGTPSEKLGVANLTNREIGLLRPNFAELITGSVTLRRDLESAKPDVLKAQNQRAMLLVNAVRMSPRNVIPFGAASEPSDVEMRFEFAKEETFVMRTTDVGLVWEVPIGQ